MIFATVGTQLPFDRMISALDEWKLSHSKEKIFAQIGQAGSTPSNIEFAHSVSPSQFERCVADCNLVVAHAGMGSVLTALKARKPLIIMPRRASYGEHRNDHQLATARKLSRLPGISVALDEDELLQQLNAPLSLKSGRMTPYASAGLLNAVAGFLAPQGAFA